MVSPMHGKKRNNRIESPMGWIGKGFCQDSVQAHKRNKGRQCKPKSPCSSHLGDKHEHSRMTQGQNGRNGMGVKEDKHKGQQNSHKGLEHHLLVPNQYRRGGSSVKGFKGYGLMVERKEVYFRVPAKVPFEENALLGQHFTQKRQARGQDHLMHAIGVSRERASNPHPFG